MKNPFRKSNLYYPTITSLERFEKKEIDVPVRQSTSSSRGGKPVF